MIWTNGLKLSESKRSTEVKVLAVDEFISGKGRPLGGKELSTEDSWCWESRVPSERSTALRLRSKATIRSMAGGLSA